MTQSTEELTPTGGDNSPPPPEWLAPVTTEAPAPTTESAVPPSRWRSLGVRGGVWVFFAVAIVVLGGADVGGASIHWHAIEFWHGSPSRYNGAPASSASTAPSTNPNFDSQPPATIGSSVTLTAGGFPLGSSGESARFVDTVVSGVTYCTGTISSSLIASCEATESKAGQYPVEVIYPGDSSNKGFTNPLPQGFTLLKPRLAVPADSTPGSAVKLTMADLPPSAAGEAVRFDDTNGNLYCSASVKAESATIASASCRTVATAVGPYAVAASYAGDSLNAPASSSGTFSISSPGAFATPGETSVTLEMSGLPISALGAIVTFESGGKVLCTGPVTTDPGAASCSTAVALAAGTYQVTAKYPGGNGNAPAAASTSFSLATALSAPTTTTLPRPVTPKRTPRRATTGGRGQTSSPPPGQTSTPVATPVTTIPAPPVTTAPIVTTTVPKPVVTTTTVAPQPVFLCLEPDSSLVRVAGTGCPAGDTSEGKVR